MRTRGRRAEDYSHHGPSIWSRETFTRIRSRLRLSVSIDLTPTTAVMLEPSFCPTYESEDQYRRDLEEKMNTWATEAEKKAFQCPAQHPVIPYELRVEMTRLGPTRKLFIECFPNAEASDFDYVPIAFYLCVVCQDVFRIREVEEVNYVPRGVSPAGV